MRKRLAQLKGRTIETLESVEGEVDGLLKQLRADGAEVRLTSAQITQLRILSERLTGILAKQYHVAGLLIGFKMAAQEDQGADETTSVITRMEDRHRSKTQKTIKPS